MVMMDPSKKAAIKCLIYPKIPPSCMLPMNCFKNASIKYVCFPLSPPSPHFTDKSFVKDESFKMTAIDYTPRIPTPLTSKPLQSCVVTDFTKKTRYFLDNSFKKKPSWHPTSDFFLSIRVLSDPHPSY